MNTILIADDDPLVRRSLCDILEIEGYRTEEASDGTEVMQSVNPCTTDVILLDINMPGMSGIEITKLLKSDTALQHIPVVIVTGENDHKLRIEALQAGAEDFLIKPPHYAELSARIKSLIKVKAYNDHMRDYQQILEKQVSERTQQLESALIQLKDASLDTIRRLSRAAEYRDEDTSTHIQRMSNYTAALAGKINLKRDEIETILYSSSMHDIGKIGIPDNILLKQGKLDAKEWKLMKEHTVIGAKILEGASSEFLVKGRVIALTHHEKWDGSGYPLGLKGEDIPIEGRIAAVADVFDALTTKRPYKEAYSFEKAMQIIREGKGSHFDPALVEAFMLIDDEVLKIMNNFNEIQAASE